MKGPVEPIWDESGCTAGAGASPLCRPSNLPRYCDHCGAVRTMTKGTHCAPPNPVRSHEWTGKHPADAKAGRVGQEHTLLTERNHPNG